MLWKYLYLTCQNLYLFSMLNHNAGCSVDNYYSISSFAHMAFEKMD